MPIAPTLAGAALLAGAQPKKGAPTAFSGAPRSRRIDVAIAACALAVVGAVSGAAALLPSSDPEASAAERHTTAFPAMLRTPDGTPLAPSPLRSASSLRNATTTPSRAALTASTRPPSEDGAAPSSRPSILTAPESPTPSASATSATRDLPTAPVRRDTPGPPAALAAPADPPSSDPTPTHSASAPAPTHDPVVPTSGQDLRAIVGGSSTGGLLGLAAKRYVMQDFDGRLMGADLRTGGIRGAGSDSTVIEMAARTSSKAGAVPTADYTTNQLYLLSTIGGTPGLSGFFLKGTDQGHLYNGLRIGHATNARVSDVRIASIPGAKSFPPGETFSLNDWRTDGSVYERIRIDGSGTAAVDFGSNSSTNITVNDSVFTGTAYSSGMAMWQTRNITLNDVTIADNRSGINFERSSGRITLNRPVFRDNRSYDMQFGSDYAEGADVVINDPVLASGQKLRLNVPLQYHGGTNGQKRGNIHVLVHGVDRTNQLVQFL